jgi:hypothetical protein
MANSYGALLFLVSFFLLAAIGIAAQSGTVRISGEVYRDHEFRKEIGGGLIFVLSPDEDNGWTITVEPKENPNDSACDDYVAVATPPYHGENARFINTAYGVKARDAVKRSPREFAFVTNCPDNHREEGWVERIVNPGGYSDQEVKEGYAKLGSSPLGKRRPDHSRLADQPGERNCGGRESGPDRLDEYRSDNHTAGEKAEN